MKVQTDKINPQTNSPTSAQEADKLKKAKAAAEFKAQTNAAQGNPQAANARDVKSEISPKALEFAKASELAKKAPDVREDKVADLKARIQSGQYKVNAESIADKIFDEHLKTNGIGN